VLVKYTARAASIMVGDGFFLFVPAPTPPVPVRPFFKPTKFAAPTIYQIDTLVQMNVTFYNVSTQQPADPLEVLLFVQDPVGNIIQFPSVDFPGSPIVRIGVGLYYCDFVPYMPGKWSYKWQGLVSGVVATTRDTPFVVQDSDLITE
jgi:hypothetical protein